MWRKIVMVLLVVMLFVPVTIYAEQQPLKRVVSENTKFKKEALSAKQTKIVAQLSKQLGKPMKERKRKIIVNYTGNWSDVYGAFDQAILAVLSEDELLSYDYRGYSYTTLETKGKKTLEVLVYYYQTANQVAYADQQVKKIVRQLTNNAMTEHEKVKVLHDYIIDNVSYDHSMNQGVNAAYFALKGGKTLCNGYAMLMYLMLKEAGLEARLASGTAGTYDNYEYHAWNMVKVEGNWYQLDPTWNDLDDGSIRYDYYLVSDAQLSQDHIWNNGGLNGDEKPYPVAKFSYFDKLLENEQQEPLQLFGYWLEPKYTAKSLRELHNLLTGSFNKLEQTFTINYIGDYAHDVVADSEGYLEDALRASGLRADYTFEINEVNFLNVSGMQIHVAVDDYSAYVEDVYYAQPLVAPSNGKTKVVMKRSDGKEIEISDDVHMSFDNATLAAQIGQNLQLRAPGVTEVAFDFRGQIFEHEVVIDGHSMLNEVAMQPFPVDGFKVMKEPIVVVPNKKWTIQASRLITKNAQPVVRAFDDQGNEVVVNVTFGGKEIRIAPPDDDYRKGTYRVFIQFDKHPTQNRSMLFHVQ